ncbi:MFS transporter [Cadophora sp. MPI-SDFR-AT-0126]|nr:MFS transporter [Leotiomycetes sp. MPI-SDFR-AT-0126]
MAYTSFSTCTAGDPKFWPAYIRHLALFNICIFVFLGNMYTAGIATGFQSLAMEFHVDFSKLTDQISYPVLALGVGNIIWTPTAVCFGKRPVIIISTALFLGCTIWSIKAKTIDSLLASRVIACFGAGSIESIGPAMIADMYRERYFATAMALFALFLSGGSQVGPMIAGFLITDKGWRWFFILCAILIAVNLAMMLIFLPETNYRRVLYEGETAQEADKQADEMVQHIEKGQETITGLPNSQNNRPYAGSYWKDLVAFRGRGIEDRGLLGWPRQFSLPFRFILVPHALFAAVSYGVLLSGVVIISTLAPQFLSPPPYLFKPSGLGLFSLSSFIGIIVGYPIAGPLTDLLSRVFARRSRAEHHVPEHRMPALIVPFIVCPPGLMLFAYIISEHKSAYIAAVGSALQAAGLVFVPSVVLSVVVDAWPQSGSEAVVLINAGKNAVAFGITLSTPKWLASEGLVKMFWEMAGIQWAVLFLGIPLYFLGPWLRRKTSIFV